MGKPKLSLQEQLLKSGLVSAAQAKTAKTNKHKQEQLQRKNNVVAVDQAKELAQKARDEQLAKDLELNQQRQQQEQQKQLLAQIKQLVAQNKLPKDDEDGIPYRFTDANQVKTVYILEEVRQKLINGQVAIVRVGNRYEIVPADIAEKIKQRDAQSIVLHNDKTTKQTSTVDDSYAGYEVPDDLMW